MAASCRSRDRLEARDIVRAAELSSADTETSDESGLLTCSDLLHLNPDAELLCKHLDQLTEVHTAVGDIIEDRLGAVSLELHITDLHLKSELGSDLTRTDHGLMLAGYRLLPSFYVEKLGLAIYPLELECLGIYPLALHLTADDRALESHDAEVMAVGSLHDHKIAGLHALA